MADDELYSPSTATVARQQWGPFYRGDRGVKITSDTNNDLVVLTTTDGGVTWTPTSAIEAGNVKAYGAWDTLESGLSDNLVHFVWLDLDDSGFKHATINISSFSVSAVNTIDTLGWTIVVTSNNSKAVVTVTPGGRIAATFGTDNTTEWVMGSYVSDNGGTSWAAAGTNPAATESGNDTAGIWTTPADTGDNEDFCLFYYPPGASDLYGWTFDASAGTWDGGQMVNLSQSFNDSFNRAAFRRNTLTGEILALLWISVFSATGDLWCMTIDVTATTGPDEAFTGQVVNDTAGGFASLSHDIQADEWHAWWFQGSGMGGTKDVYYSTSVDAGATWSAGVQWSEDPADDIRPLSMGSVIGDAGGWLNPIWFNDDFDAYYQSLVSAIEISTSSIPVDNKYQTRRTLVSPFTSVAIGGGGNDVALPRRYGQGRREVIPLTLFNTNTLAGENDYAWADGDLTLVLDGAAPVAPTNDVEWDATSASWGIVIEDSEYEAAEILFKFADQTNPKVVNDVFMRVETKGHPDAFHNFESGDFADEMFPHTADIWVQDDDAAAIDRYSIVFYKGGLRVSGAVVAAASPTIRVYEIASGDDLIAVRALTRTPDEDSFFYEAGEDTGPGSSDERMVSGMAYMCEILYNDMTEPFSVTLGRDSVAP
jgi:hypothetical protein